jgi:hypothetical protein
MSDNNAQGHCYKGVVQHNCKSDRRRIGGEMFSVLAIGGIKPGRGDGLLRATEIRSTASFGEACSKTLCVIS